MIKTDDALKSVTPNTGSQKMLDNIVNYWNTAGLCSLDSSTSMKDEHIAIFENYIESRLLSEILAKYCIQRSNHLIGLDVGAGLGRFSVVLAQYLKHVYAIEPAPQLYVKLKDRCKIVQNISVSNESLESFASSEMVDFTVVSGVLYLYNDEMLSYFMDRLDSLLRPRGVIVIRDFIVPGEVKKLRSSYVKGAHCYYRDLDYWQKVAEQYNMDLVEVFRSVPLYNPYVAKIMAPLGLNRIYALSFVKKMGYARVDMLRKDNGGFKDGEINTVFITLVKKGL